MGMLKVKSYVTGQDVYAALGKHLGYASRALINKNARALVEQGLVSEFAWPVKGSPPGDQRELLTDLGGDLLRRVERYDAFKTRPKS
jgi:hypothetical protein